MQKVVMWERMDGVGLEHASYDNAPDGIWRVSSVIFGLSDNRPFHVNYAINYEPSGRLIGATLLMDRTKMIDSKQFVSVVYMGDKKWEKKAQHNDPLYELRGCGSLDIVETPFTNTLAIKQLSLKPGESGEITVAWFHLAEGTWQPDRQRYTCIERSAQGSVYQFEQLSSGFTATIPFDENDLVIDYPELFRRVYPKVSDR